MRGIPHILGPPLREALSKCDEFEDQSQLKDLFVADELIPWRDGLKIFNNTKAQVNGTIAYLADKRNTKGQNILVLFLKMLAANYDPSDERHDLLVNIADQLDWYVKKPSKKETIISEANPEKENMLWITDAEKILRCAYSVAKIQVPQYFQGKKNGKKSGTGTAWMIAPGLGITCLHVLENRDKLDGPVEQNDFEEQIRNALLTFDYTISGKGAQYSINSLEYPNFETQTLDYAIFRLNDRSDYPLSDRGFNKVDIDAPLTDQSSLYIIQHPLGQPQQSSGGNFLGYSMNEHLILYDAPTEKGTSGSPVFNRVNWNIVALHNGENRDRKLREGTRGLNPFWKI